MPTVATKRRTKTTNPVTAYAEGVVGGDVLTGNLVRQACQRHLDDLATGQARGLWFDTAAVERGINFFSLLRQSKGRWANEPLILLPWQEFVVGSILGWKRKDGLRRFRRAYVSVARKNGKTTLAGGLGLWLAFFDGESGAEVYSAAVKRDQAKLCWNEAYQMVLRTEGLRRRIGHTPSRANLYQLETASKFEALGAEADSTHGLNVHGAIIDELHVHPTRHLVDALETAMGARTQPLAFFITTAGVAGESIYQETDSYARRVVDGLPDDEWFVYLANLDDADDWTNPECYAKANPSLGMTVLLEELVQERDRAIEVPGRQNPFRRLRLNQITEQVNRWLDMSTWDACGQEPVDPQALEGRPCYAGLDLSSTTDITSLALVFPAGGHYDVLTYHWVPQDNLRQRAERDRVPYPLWAEQEFIQPTQGNVVDYDVIRARISELSQRYNIREIAIDRWNSTQLQTQLQGDGLTVVPFGQGFASMTAPTKELEKLVLGRGIRHGGNPVLRWMASNVAVRQDPAGNLKPDKEKSTEKIDGIVALVMALGRAIAHGEVGSVYDTGESLFL